MLLALFNWTLYDLLTIFIMMQLSVDNDRNFLKMAVRFHSPGSIHVQELTMADVILGYRWDCWYIYIRLLTNYNTEVYWFVALQSKLQHLLAADEVSINMKINEFKGIINWLTKYFYKRRAVSVLIRRRYRTHLIWQVLTRLSRKLMAIE